MPVVFKIQSEDNPWDSIVLDDGDELVVGTKVYEGERNMLVGGVETKVADKCWGGSYLLENGKSVEITDGVITEINDVPTPEASVKDKMIARKLEIKKNLEEKYK